MANNGGAMLKAAGLWAKTSASGNAYMAGRLGGVRIMIFENRDRQSDDDPTHVLMFADGDKPKTGAASRQDGQGRGSRPSPMSSRPQAADRPRRTAKGLGVDPRDPVDDLSGF